MKEVEKAGIEAAASRTTGRAEKPIRNLVLSLTGDCNYACRYCYASEHPREMMSRETALRAVELAARSGERFIIQFTGGEPLLAFPLIQAVTELVEERGLPAIMQIQTNGSLLTRETAAYLFKHKIGIGVSLDGRPPVNDRLRLRKDGGSASEATIAGLRLLASMGIGTGITCVVTEENVEELPGIIEMAFYLGNVRQLGFDLLRGQGRGSGLHPADPEKTERAFTRVYDLAEKFRKLTGIPIRFTQQQRVCNLAAGSGHVFGHCYAMNGEAAFVAADGKIYACSSLMGMPEFQVGDVESGIDRERSRLVGERIAGAMKACRSCEDFSLCGGGCFARFWGRRQAGEDGPAAPEECAMQRVSIRYALKGGNTAVKTCRK